MKHTLIPGITFLLFVACTSSPQKSTISDPIDTAKVITSDSSSSSPTASTGTNEDVLEAVKKESKIKDAVVTSANVLYAAVDDDGTDRSGYASYLCQLVRDIGYRQIFKVKVVAYGTMKSKDADNAYGKLLGESSCDF